MLNIRTITTPFIFNITVNCYLVKLDDGFILIDTAKAGKRRVIEDALREAGCQPGDLKLIILTHGDFDHCGNAAYLRDTFHAQIAMHEDDLGMVEQGNMFWNRKQPNPLVKMLMGLIFRLSEADRFKPDITVQDGDDFIDFGFDARVVELPGHSSGSIGVLTRNGELFCGDLLGNTKQPELWTIKDDPQTAATSIENLRNLPVYQVYPGHGQSFPMHAFWNRYDPLQDNTEVQPVVKQA